MARTPWVVDGHAFANKVKNARGSRNWRSDATIACPNCMSTISNAHVAQEWPGLPAGVKFDPSDQELLQHLAAKVGIGNTKPHAFIDEFILTLEEVKGICYTHPENLPGIRQDGSSIHFFHKTTNAYTTGERKRRKITNNDRSGEVRWHKTGKTKPVIENGEQQGCKKIMVLYTSVKGSKAEKTNWVMHQYHLGTEEDEKEGEFVVSKVFYQQQTKQCEKSDPDIPQEEAGASISKGDPVTPKTNTPFPPRSGKPHSCLDVIEEEHMPIAVSPQAAYLDAINFKVKDVECDTQNYFSNATLDYSLWSAGESQFLEDSQEIQSLLCSEMLGNQSCGDTVEAGNSMPDFSECGRITSDESEVRQKFVEVQNNMPNLAECGHIGNNEPKQESRASNEAEQKCIANIEPIKDLDSHVDPVLAKIEFDTPPDGPITFSQFSSPYQDTESLLGWLNQAMGDSQNSK